MRPAAMVPSSQRPARKTVKPLHGCGRDRRSRLLASLWISLDRLGKIRRYIGAGPVPAGCIAFGEKLFVGGHRRGARHSELRGQLPGGWQLRSRPQAPGQDRRAKLQIELAEKRRVALANDLECIKVCPALSVFHVGVRMCVSTKVVSRFSKSGPFRQTTIQAMPAVRAVQAGAIAGWALSFRFHGDQHEFASTTSRRSGDVRAAGI